MELRIRQWVKYGAFKQLVSGFRIFLSYISVIYIYIFKSLCFTMLNKIKWNTSLHQDLDILMQDLKERKQNLDLPPVSNYLYSLTSSSQRVIN